MRGTIRLLALVVVTAAFIGIRADAEGASNDIYSLLTGEWGSQTNTCASNPHSISFSEDRSFAVFTYRSPPKVSHNWPGLPIEKQSPEYGAENTIRFHVLDHGATWIALRREEEKELDRLGNPRTWKLRLTKDRKGYRWQLYNAVGWKKSLLRGVSCEASESEE